MWCGHVFNPCKGMVTCNPLRNFSCGEYSSNRLSYAVGKVALINVSRGSMPLGLPKAEAALFFLGLVLLSVRLLACRRSRNVEDLFSRHTKFSP